MLTRIIIILSILGVFGLLLWWLETDDTEPWEIDPDVNDKDKLD